MAKSCSMRQRPLYQRMTSKAASNDRIGLLIFNVLLLVMARMFILMFRGATPQMHIAEPQENPICRI